MHTHILPSQTQDTHILPSQTQDAPATKSSKRSVTPGLERCGLASGLISTGCSSTNVGCSSPASAVASNSSFNRLPTVGAPRTLAPAERRASGPRAASACAWRRAAHPGGGGPGGGTRHGRRPPVAMLQGAAAGRCCPPSSAGAKHARKPALHKWVSRDIAPRARPRARPPHRLRNPARPAP
jgi:hypothetical protein